jgi:general secretion pathway protein J
MRNRALRRGRRAPEAGFTLVEVLVALLIMAILATLSWQGLDGILRAREGSRDSIDKSVRLATVLTQWEQDLQAVYDTGVVPAVSFDGQTLRLTRRAEGGVLLVAWSVRGGLWQRWTGRPVTRGGELQELWLRSQQLQGSEPGHLTLSEDASQWQVYFNRGGQWTNAQSTGDLVQQIVVAPTPTAAPPAAASAPDASASAPAAAASAPALAATAAREVLPEAVRLQITLGGRALTRDIALGAS